MAAPKPLVQGLTSRLCSHKGLHELATINAQRRYLIYRTNQSKIGLGISDGEMRQ